MPAQSLASSSTPPDLFRQELAAVVLLIGAFAFLFRNILFSGEIFYFRDILQYAYPMKRFLWESFHNGSLPLWWPEISGGVPFLALMHPGAFYPLSALFFLDDFNTAFNLFFLIQHWLLTIFVYALCRNNSMSPAASCGAAIVALYGGFFLSLSSYHNHFQSAIWFPLSLLLFREFAKTRHRASFAGLVIILAVQLLGGSPEMCLLSYIVLTLYALFMIPGSQNFGSASRVGWLMFSILLAMVLSAMQLLPTFRLLEQTVRTEGLDFAASVRWSLLPGDLKAFVLPENFRQYMFKPGATVDYFLQSPYMGLLAITTLLLTLLCFLRNRALSFWTILFALGIFFALGEHNPLYVWFFDHAPLFDKFRYPAKFLFLSAFALVFIAGHGIDLLADKLKAKPEANTVLRWILVALIFSVVSLSLSAPGRGILSPLIFFSSFIVAASLLAKSRMSAASFKWILVLLSLAELSYRNIPLIPSAQDSFYAQPPTLARFFHQQEPPFRIYSGDLDGKVLPTKQSFPKAKNMHLLSRTYKERLYPNLSSAYGVESVDGLTALKLKDVERWTQTFINASNERRKIMLERSNARYWITEELSTPLSETFPVGLNQIVELREPLPRAFIVGETRRVSDADAMSLYFDPSFDPKQVALTEAPLNLKGGAPFTDVSNSIAYARNGLSLEIRLDRPGMLTLLDNWFPGWEVSVNGQAAQALKINGMYRGVALGAGMNRVEWKFWPEGLSAGLSISGAGLVFLLLTLRLGWKRRGA
ncbi:MAG: hypothetical protein G3M78_02360 [Candidatus Nitrohelix vancouverensis]|uniref:YfhO family protein n=1 Tax=Candidatus Nitrohelix vancouverensis TaxID=2705534 RepID=A0A7T0C0H0_9BACT|nr:MAG: hypothetical protein G3M78_02360 [Candidatus Nitrohelix vancouverensis]